MPMTIDAIVEETRRMPGEMVTELIDRILLERHGGIGDDVGAAWDAEIDLRVREIQHGRVEGRPVEETLARVRRIAGL